jgi:hypothetical protein
MTARYHIDRDLKLLTITAEGVITDTDYFAFRADIHRDPAFADTELRIYDIRTMTKLEFSTFSLWKFAYEALMKAGARRVFVTAPVIPPDLKAAFQLLHMIQGKSTHITPDMNEAWRWLGLPAERQPVVNEARAAA